MININYIKSLYQDKKTLMYGLGGLVILVAVYYFFFRKSEDSPVIEENESLEESGELNNINDSNKVKVLNFNTSWCRYSVMFAPEWSKFEALVENMADIDAIDIKCDDDNNSAMCQNFNIPGFPSVVILKGDKRIDYKGQRSAEAILDFVRNL